MLIMKGSARLSTLLEAFFLERLMQQRQVSPHTIASYRDTFRLLLQFTEKRLRKPPSSVTVPDLTEELISGFLNHLEKERGTVSRRRGKRHAVREMKEDPSEPSCRGRLQTAMSCY